MSLVRRAGKSIKISGRYVILYYNRALSLICTYLLCSGLDIEDERQSALHYETL